MSDKSQRLLSLDFFRGATMLLLIGEFSHVFRHLRDQELKGSVIYSIGEQFGHAQWHGITFWDLVQPFFTFIVGVAMPMSFAKRLKKGDSYTTILRHIIKRCFLLLLLGWALYCIGPGKIVFNFNNVLAQLSISIFIAFIIIRKSFWFQLGVSLLLILVSELLYRNFWVEGFNQAFVVNKNFGSWVEMQILGELSGRGWVPFNAIPTTAHTIWGVLAGKLLMSDKSKLYKFKMLVIAGAFGLVLGFGLDYITPIIKRIATSSFVIVSGGWSLLALAFSYYFIDVLGFKKGVLIFAIVGMNPLFIYLFSHVGGANLLIEIVQPFVKSMFGFTGPLLTKILISSVAWFGLWYICYFMYKKKVFINI